jgi:hypothetical protein
MDTKKLAAIILAIALIGAAYYIANASTPPAPEAEGEYPAPFLSEENTTIDEFAQNLLLAEKVAIVEDLRGLDAYPLTRNNIMQCAVDFSGSEGLVGKELYVYAFEGEACTSNEGVETIEECYPEIEALSKDPSASVIWIERGSGPAAYSSNLLVKINEQYSQGECSVTLKVPQQHPQGNETSQGEPGANQTLEETLEQNETLPGAAEEQNGTLPGGPSQNETGGEEPPASNSSDAVTFG